MTSVEPRRDVTVASDRRAPDASDAVGRTIAVSSDLLRGPIEHVGELDAMATEALARVGCVWRTVSGWDVPGPTSFCALQVDDVQYLIERGEGHAHLWVAATAAGATPLRQLQRLVAALKLGPAAVLAVSPHWPKQSL